MDVSEFKNKLKSGDLAGWYIFAGEEEYLKKYYLAALRDAVLPDPTLAPFNHLVFDGAEPDVAALTDAVKSPPMMGEYKLIEWRYADFEHMKESTRRALDDLCAVKNDYPFAILAFLLTPDGFDAGTDKRPGKTATRYAKHFSVLRFEKSTDAQLLSWLKKHFDAEGIAVGRTALEALLFRAGHGMDVLNGEVAKLCAYAKANGLAAVDEKTVADVASSTLECDTFALSNAITQGNREAAYTALADMKARRVDPGAVLGMMAKTYSELVTVSLLLDEGKDTKAIETVTGQNAYKIKLYVGAAKRHGTKKLSAALSALSAQDAASKSGGVIGFGAIERFVASHL